MAESQCYLCGTPGKFEKLFRRCKHESACYGCLRNRYVIQAKHVSQYPLQCFHPECNLVVRNTQIERFVQCKQELQNYHCLSAKAKMHKVRLGDNWQEVFEVLGEALGTIEICCCPGCKMLIEKNGGCDHMSCICGTDFNWSDFKFSCERISENDLVEDYATCWSKSGPAGCSRGRTIRWARSRSRCGAMGDIYDKIPPAYQIDADFVEDYADYLPLDESVLDESVGAFAENTEDVSDDSFEAVDSAGQDDTQTVKPMTFDLDSFPPLEARVTDVSETGANTSENDFHVLEIASDASDDSWTQFDGQNDDFQSFHSQSTWEEISEVSSVASFHSKTGLSFLETARAKASNQQEGKQNKWKEVSKVPSPIIKMQTIAEFRKPSVSEEDDDQGEMFDAEFMFEGAKCSRGGKQKFMFKHQPRRKYHRRDRYQRQKSGARVRDFYRLL